MKGQLVISRWEQVLLEFKVDFFFNQQVPVELIIQCFTSQVGSESKSQDLAGALFTTATIPYSAEGSKELVLYTCRVMMIGGLAETAIERILATTLSRKNYAKLSTGSIEPDGCCGSRSTLLTVFHRVRGLFPRASIVAYQNPVNFVWQSRRLRSNWSHHPNEDSAVSSRRYRRFSLRACVWPAWLHGTLCRTNKPTCDAWRALAPEALIGLLVCERRSRFVVALEGLSDIIRRCANEIRTQQFCSEHIDVKCAAVANRPRTASHVASEPQWTAGISDDEHVGGLTATADQSSDWSA